MTKVRTWVGLDVHAATAVACVVDAESGEMIVQRLSGDTSEVARFCAALPGPVRVAYEAGPTGFDLARALEAAGVDCVIAAPGKIERPAQDKVKTDRRDAERLVRLLMINGSAPSPCPKRRGGGAARPGPRARGHPRRFDARPAPAGQAPVAPRRPLRRTPRALDLGPPRNGCPRSSSASAARRRRCLTISARSTRFDPPRRARADDRRARPHIALGRAGRQAVLPARHRHPLRGRTVRRDPRLHPLRAPQKLMSYLGLVPSEKQLRPDTPPRRDHQVPLGSRPPATRRSRLALPPPARNGPATQAPPTRPARRRRSRSPGKHSNASTTSGDASTPSAANAKRSSPSPSPDTSPASAGRSPTPTPDTPDHPSPPTTTLG